ncbi:MAG: hypothetical protein AAF438_05900, partial [Pseudomonadota bacterium]
MRLLLIVALFFSTGVFAEEPNTCDLEVGHPSDPRKVGPGKSSSEVKLQLAVPGCREAVKNHPDNPRFHYQLGRALIYWADINNGDDSEGTESVRRAAEMDYPQALFVMGLLHKREKEACAAEPLTKRAADLELKSARITYVHDALNGIYEGCLTVDKKIMMEYLEKAATQVSGYYESLLLTNLKRE